MQSPGPQVDRAQLASKLRWSLFALFFSAALLIAKFAAWFSTQSTAILSDALESIVNIITSSFALYAVWLGEQPEDEDHPYGHGKVEYFSVGLEGLFILGAGISIGWMAAQDISSPPELRSLGQGVIWMALISAACLAGGTLIIKMGRRYQSHALEADGHHIRTDAITSMGALAGLALVLGTGAVWIDAVVSLAMAAWLTRSGLVLLRRAIEGLMDAADPALLDQIAQTLEATREPGWLAPHRARVHQLGTRIHIDLHLVFPRYWDLEKTHEATLRLEERLRQDHGANTEAMIHMEPCTPPSCTYCDLEGCPVRSAAFVARHRWTGAQIARTQRPPKAPPRP